jgi:RNA polymerase sigma-70 factor (ECF subfamily)
MQAAQPKPHAGSDEELFERFRRTREREALAELARRWHAPAFRIARSVCLNDALAEEAVQDGFVELLAQRSRFADRGPGSFRSWFLMLVANRARMVRRRERRSERKRRVDAQSFLLRKGLDAPDGPRRAEPRDLHAALAQIEERFRTPILLYFMEGLQQQEVASRLGVSQQAISRRIEQGLQRLRAHALMAAG